MEKLKAVIELSSVKIDVVLSYCKYALNDTELLDYLPWFQEQGIAVINASPFAMGLLTDRGIVLILRIHFSERLKLLDQFTRYDRNDGL